MDKGWVGLGNSFMMILGSIVEGGDGLQVQRL
ncbi:MAG: hypothetical protein RLZZ180_1485 [Pseudomonadota bacterium]|jgi:hypothetical protein